MSPAGKRPGSKMPSGVTLEQYFTAAALTGILAAQHREPNQAFVCELAMKFGRRMAAAFRQHRQPKAAAKRATSPEVGEPS
jgi:hypothetical protein